MFSADSYVAPLSLVNIVDISKYVKSTLRVFKNLQAILEVLLEDKKREKKPF